jgi:hypothetical protein
MFCLSTFNKPIDKWNVSNVKTMRGMFSKSKFNQNISKWEINPKCDTENMFYNCNINKEFIPKGVSI